VDARLWPFDYLPCSLYHLWHYLTSSWVRIVGEVIALDNLDLRVVDLLRAVRVPMLRA
jgi:hypothetical protein